jgi:hypothetical protein
MRLGSVGLIGNIHFEDRESFTVLSLSSPFYPITESTNSVTLLLLIKNAANDIALIPIIV